MITDCPSCQRQFRINAGQLSAAKGLVQCGFCGEQFNALERLHDRPLPRSEFPDTDPGSIDEDTYDEPQFEIPAGKPFVDSPDTSVQKQGPGPGSASDNSSKPPTRSLSPMLDDDELAMEYLVQTEQPRSKWGTILWSFAVICMLFISIVQLAWFNRDQLLNRYPEHRALAKQACERLRCELVRERDLSTIVLVNRDVRDHPRYEESLLVNATIENQSEVIQPYPGLRLTLYDTEGKITGFRIFSPADYLDKTVDVDSGMPSRIPVHLVLELTGASEAAVSFEFHFI